KRQKGKMKLTKNFDSTEFDSKDGAGMPAEVLCNVRKVAENLQELRDELKAPITINSGYRSPAHNKKVGGAAGSTHLTGEGADIVVKGFSPAEVYQTIERLQAEGRMEQGGLHAYATFTHYDIGYNNRRRRW